MAKTRVHLHQLVLLHFFSVLVFATDEKSFIYNGFQGANLHIDGIASILPGGLLQITNTTVQKTGHAFYPKPLKFRWSLSFSTTFVFAMYHDASSYQGHGIAFVISPTMNFENAFPSEYLGLLNTSNNGLPSNHLFAVELDTVKSDIFGDIDGNHIGIDVNGLKSVDSASAVYYSEKEGTNRSLQLTGRKSTQIWIDYDGSEMLVNVTIAPFGLPKPSKCLLSTHVNLSEVFFDSMYVGFSSSTGIRANNHYIQCWSWSQTGQAQAFNLSKLPSLPKIKKHKKKPSPVFLTLLGVMILFIVVLVGAAYTIQRKKYGELLEAWEQEYCLLRVSYKELYLATKGFKNSELLGSGGFGKVFKGVLRSNATQVAVKRVSHDSNQGMKEFVAEIASMTRLRHRNLVQLLGYCRRKEELLLVYDYMPNGSLDTFLFSNSNKPNLSWPQRTNIVKGVASVLLYLHEECEQVVLHRDVKSSNVLLDADMNARLGDFGLARLYDHGSHPQTTHLVGTVGYLAPELNRTRKPSTVTDVFAFGIFLLEVASGRRSLGLHDSAIDDFVLLDWVYDSFKKGAIIDTCDPRLEGKFNSEDMEMVLKLGLLCSNPMPESRPSMRHVVQYLYGEASLPDVPSNYDLESDGLVGGSWGTSTTLVDVSLATMSSDNSVLHCGR